MVKTRNRNSRRSKFIEMEIGTVMVFNKTISSSIRAQLCEITRTIGNRYESVITDKQIRVTRIS